MSSDLYQISVGDVNSDVLNLKGDDECLICVRQMTEPCLSTIKSLMKDIVIV